MAPFLVQKYKDMRRFYLPVNLLRNSSISSDLVSWFFSAISNSSLSSCSTLARRLSHSLLLLLSSLFNVFSCSCFRLIAFSVSLWELLSFSCKNSALSVLWLVFKMSIDVISEYSSLQMHVLCVLDLVYYEPHMLCINAKLPSHCMLDNLFCRELRFVRLLYNIQIY